VVGAGSFGSFVVDSKSLTVRGGGSDLTTVTGGLYDRCVEVNAVPDQLCLVGLTLTGGNFPTDGIESQGAGLFASNSRVIIDSCVISGNYSKDSGGGLSFRSGSSFVISYSHICDNTAGQSGGGLVAVEADSGRLVRCVVDGNQAGANSGGVFLYSNSSDCSRSFEVINCQITNNVGSDFGARIGARRVELAMTNTIIAYND
jgi:hypothetical protein